MQESTRNVFDTLAKMLLRCWIFGFVLLAIWLGADILLGDIIHKLHGPMFGITIHEWDVIFYCALGILKVQRRCQWHHPQSPLSLDEAFEGHAIRR